MYLVASVLDSADTEHFHHHRKVCWIAVVLSSHFIDTEIEIQEVHNLSFACWLLITEVSGCWELDLELRLSGSSSVLFPYYHPLNMLVLS